MAQSEGRSLCHKAQDKPCPNSCQAQSLIMRRAKAWQDCSRPQARCGSGPHSLFSISIPSSSACRQAQTCQGQILLRGHTMSLLAGARTELLVLQCTGRRILAVLHCQTCPVKLGQGKGHYSREAQPATPSEGWGGTVRRKTTPAAPGKHPLRYPAHPSPLPQAQDHLLHTSHLCNQPCNFLPQLLHPLLFFAQRVPADTRADLVRGLAAQPLLHLQAHRQVETQVLEPPFLFLLCGCFPSPAA